MQGVKIEHLTVMGECVYTFHVEQLNRVMRHLLAPKRIDINIYQQTTLKCGTNWFLMWE